MNIKWSKVRKKIRRAVAPLVRSKVIETDGIRFKIHPGDNGTERSIWLNGRLPEKQSLDALAAVVSGKRALFFDIGANCGIYSVFIGKAVQPGSEILAFEPNPVMRERLNFNLSLNNIGNAKILACALGSENGHAPLHFAAKQKRNMGEASLLRPSGSTEAIEVEVRTLSSFMPDDASDYDVIALKIDVEGYEDQVLLPFFRDMGPEVYPNFILIEVAHSHKWSVDLESALTNIGYHLKAEMDRNQLYAKSAFN